MNEPIDITTAVAVREPAALPSTEVLPPEQGKATTPAQAKVDAVANLTFKAYELASQLKLTPEEIASLQQEFPDEAFRTGAAGKENLIYIEHAYLRDRLNTAIGVGQWAIIPRSRWAEDFTFTNKYKETVEASRVYVEAMLVIRGAFVAEAIGDMVYYKNNESGNYGDAVEGAKTAAFRRCAKELGVGLQAWKKEFCEGWWARRKSGPPGPTPMRQAQAQEAKAKPAPAPMIRETPEQQRQRFIAKCIQAGGGKPDYAEELFREMALLLPNESLKDFPLAKLPKTKVEADNVFAEIVARSGAGEPPDDGPPDSRPRVTGILAFVTEKSGEKNGKTWTRFGMKIGDTWYDSFDKKLGAAAKAAKGQEVTIIYEEHERNGRTSNDAQAIIIEGVEYPEKA